MSLVRRRRGKASRLARRYGCFRLPEAGAKNDPTCKPSSCVAGAKVVKRARKGANWLARTDPDNKEVEFSESFGRLDPESKRYIVLHEKAHLETGPDHDDEFYTALKKLVEKHHVSWKVAYALEAYNCHRKN